MSKLVAVRLPDDVAAKIAESGRSVSGVLVDAARAYFVMVEIPQSVKQEKPVKAKKAKPVQKVVEPDQLDVALALAASGDEEPEPEKPSGCAKHPGGPGWPKAGGWWCATCGKTV